MQRNLEIAQIPKLHRTYTCKYVYTHICRWERSIGRDKGLHDVHVDARCSEIFYAI